MIYHQFVTIWTLKHSLLWFPTHLSNMVHTLALSFINKCVPKWVTISLTLFGSQYTWHMSPLFTSVIFDNLFTKHSTHMAYISRPLARKFRILQIRRIDLSKFEIHFFHM